MKNYLLLLIGVICFSRMASATEKGLNLGVEGWLSTYGFYANQTGANKDAAKFNLKKEYEFGFSGDIELENGAKIGASINLGNKDSKTEVIAISEYIYFQNTWGKLFAGAQYNPAYLMQVTPPTVDAEIDGFDPTYTPIVVSGNYVADSTYAMYGDSDETTAGADKIVYMTPDIGGFQLGLAYAPDYQMVNSRGTMSTENDEFFSVAATYDTKDMFDVNFKLGAGYNKLPNLSSLGDVSKNREWNVGLVAEYQNFSMGANYFNDKGAINFGFFPVFVKTEALATGINYKVDKLTYGISYLHKKAKNLEGDITDNLNRYMAGIRYAYGSGMSLNGSVSYHDYDSNYDSDYEGDATVVAIGTVINF